MFGKFNNKSYSVAIRTLGLNPDLLHRELESIFAQTIQPEKVTIYIAEGYKQPDFKVKDEEYVFTRKGMMSQRALEYKDIDSNLILFLDDDVVLEPNSVEKLFIAMSEEEYDCVAPDIFKNHEMSLKDKLYAIITNLTFPHFYKNLAFKVHRNGSFSYLNSPKKNVYPSQSASGPCSLWKKESFLHIRMQDELWLEDLGFPFGEDQLYFYKLYKNGGRIGIHFDSGIMNMNGQTSSSNYISDPIRFYNRTKAQYLTWHRSQMSWRKSKADKGITKCAFWVKFLLTIPVHIGAIISTKNFKIPYLVFKGVVDGIKYTQNEKYKNLPDYISN